MFIATNRHRWPAGFALIVCALALVSVTRAGDWPAYKHDSQRSSATADPLALPLRLAWHYRSAQPPSPAWPDTFKLLNRTDFDYAPHPVIAGGVVCFGSTTDDAVRALDANTGAEKWRFITGGPVRVAPQLDAGRAYFGSDDGFVYCVDAATGKLVWRFFASPRDERMAGNHRMISRWPVRTGVIVEDGVVYAVAGLWSNEGVFAYALRADDGRLVWCNDSLGFIGVAIVDFPSDGDPRHAQPGGHNGEFAANAAIGSNPQGPMLIGGDLLLIPNGNSGPTFLNKRTGRLASPYSNNLAAGTGGTWLTIDGETLFAFSKHRANQLLISPRPLTGGTAKKAWGATSNPPVPQLTIEATSDKVANVVQARGKVTAVIQKGKLLARAAYGLALADKTLIVGEEDAVVAQDPDTEREFWRAAVNGEARELAVADGRLYVGTSAGDIYCFEPAPKGAPATPTVHDPGASLPPPAPAPPAVANAIEYLRTTGMDRGFALVLGDADGQFAAALAANSRLRVVVPMTDEPAAAALREKLVARTNLYGSRVHVATVSRIDRLPFAQYFANAVIVAGALPAQAMGPEIHRVLRPCGGVLLMPGLKPADADALAKACVEKTNDARVLESPAGVAVVRGKLPGAHDWDSREADRLVRWPLRPLWFGGPGTEQTQGGDGPIVAAGRYYVSGMSTVTAVDAYNGEVLWTRGVPRNTPTSMMVDGVIHPVAEQLQFGRFDAARNLKANDKFLYLQMGKAYFEGYRDELANVAGEEIQGRSRAEGVIQLDARTGEQVKLAAAFNPQAPIALKGAKSWKLEVDAKRSGTIELEPTDKALVIRLTTKDPIVTKLDGWQLFFDFRPWESRYGLYERGTFCVRVNAAHDKNTPASWTPGNGPAFPAIDVVGTRVPDGTSTTLTLPWAEVEKLVGFKPTSFGFGATFNSNDGARGEPIARRHLFCDWCADGINNGWGTIVLDGHAKPADGMKPPPILVSAIGDAAGSARGIGDVVTAVREELRVHPLTGELQPKMFRIGGCGGLAQSAVLRSGSQSIYDFEDDSGMRPIGGLKVRCTTAEIAALGLLTFSEELGHCVCNYPVRTTLALAPAERRLEEDWAFYFDRPADTYLRLAAINFGAPGDRRDAGGTLWLGYPRLPGEKSKAFPIPAAKDRTVGANGVWLRVMSAALQVPVDVECFGGADAYAPREDLVAPHGWMSVWSPARNRKDLGPYRVNADRTQITGTDRPWLYASGYRGIHKASLKLTFLQPIVTRAAEQPPALDGKLAGEAWKGEPQVKLPFTGADIYVRHDKDNLYIAARRPAVVDRLGFVSGWTKSAAGEDAKVWQDDSFEVFLADRAGKRVVHLGVSASGARYDALATEAGAEDASWNGQWKSAVNAQQSPRAVKPGDAAKNPVPSTEAMVKVNPSTKKKSDAGAEGEGDALDLEFKPRDTADGPAANEPPLVFEIAIPWKTLEDAGIRRDALAMNCQVNQRDTSGEPAIAPGVQSNPRAPTTAGEALSYLGIDGRSRCRNFANVGIGAPPETPARRFTLRLHFAELDDTKPGQRVFDVKLQGDTVLKAFDVVKEAGSPRKAVVKEFQHVAAKDVIALEFVPSDANVTAANAPIVSAMEVFDESYRAPTVK